MVRLHSTLGDDSMTTRRKFLQTAALALLIVVGFTIGRSADAITANFGANLAGSPPIGSALVLAFGYALKLAVMLSA